MNKEYLMKKLLDLYEQRKFVEPKSSRLILNDYIRKLELELAGMLMEKGE